MKHQHGTARRRNAVGGEQLPQPLFLPDNAILTADSGSVANWYARDVKIRPGMQASLSGGLASMGPAIPYAIAAKMCYPDRLVVAMAGDVRCR